MATKSIILDREYETRKDRKVQELIQKGLVVIIDHLYEEGYLDPEYDTVEARITVRSSKDVPGHLS